MIMRFIEKIASSSEFGCLAVLQMPRNHMT